MIFDQAAKKVIAFFKQFYIKWNERISKKEMQYLFRLCDWEILWHAYPRQLRIMRL